MPIDREKGFKEHCHTGHHVHHTFVPWMWGEPYDKKCLICGHAAAMDIAGNYLCDCCAEDWHQYPLPEGVRKWMSRKAWTDHFNKFQEEQKKKLGITS
jgi:hypothetical protein